MIASPARPWLPSLFPSHLPLREGPGVREGQPNTQPAPLPLVILGGEQSLPSKDERWSGALNIASVAFDFRARIGL
jgi:hypothetical protein